MEGKCDLPNSYTEKLCASPVIPETHKELKRITRVHSVRTFSLPSTIFGNTRSSYANDLHTQGGGGGDSHMKWTGMLIGNFEFNP